MKVGSFLFCNGSTPYTYRGEVYKVSKIHYTKPVVQLVNLNLKPLTRTPVWVPLSEFLVIPEKRLYEVEDMVKIIDVSHALSRMHSNYRIGVVVGTKKETYRNESYLIRMPDGFKVWFNYPGLVKYVKPTRHLPDWF